MMDSWQHHRTIRVAEHAGVGAAQFPVSFELDTGPLVEAGAMRADGADVRITLGNREIPCQLEKTDAGHTRITFQIDLEANEVRKDALLHYGNPDAEMPDYDRSWGSISPTNDGFENELLRVRYGVKVGTFGSTWGCQTEFVIKKYGEDQFGGEQIPDSWAKSRNDVTYWERDTRVGPTFEVEADGPVYKRVRFFAELKMVEEKDPVRDLSQRVTFFRNTPFLFEEYENILGAVVDTAAPGGMRLRTDGQRNFDYFAHAFDPAQITWDGIGSDKETRGG